MNTEIIESIREIVRTALMAVIPIIIYDLEQNQIHWQGWAIATIIALLSGMDKLFHKTDTQLFKSMGSDHAGLIPV